MEQVIDSLKGNTPIKSLFYAALGTILGVITGLIYRVLHRRRLRVLQLSEELGKNLEALIEQGEGPTLEFKSSFRWDLEKSSVNRALETVVIKTLAGYMNVAGGTLLIGVADNGKILGLDNDYLTLKKKDRDGFEQAVMTAVSTNLGADLCQFVQILFHSIEKLDVCRVIVAPSGRPVIIKQGGNPRLYVRTGGSTRELNVQEAIDYVSRRWSK
ncbi:MAG: ATP-binding protein [Amphritea sp.]